MIKFESQVFSNFNQLSWQFLRKFFEYYSEGRKQEKVERVKCLENLKLFVC